MTHEPPTPSDRSRWPVRMSRLGDESCDADVTTAEQRLAMMWELVTQSWAVAGKPIPDYERADTPVRVRPLDQAGDE